MTYSVTSLPFITGTFQPGLIGNTYLVYEIRLRLRFYDTFAFVNTRVGLGFSVGVRYFKTEH